MGTWAQPPAGRITQGQDDGLRARRVGREGRGHQGPGISHTGLCAWLREARYPLCFLLLWPPHHFAHPHCVLNVQHFYSRPESTGRPLAQDMLWTPALREYERRWVRGKEGPLPRGQGTGCGDESPELKEDRAADTGRTRSHRAGGRTRWAARPYLLFLVSYCRMFLMKCVFFRPLCLGDPDICLVLQVKSRSFCPSQTHPGPRREAGSLPLTRGTSHCVFQKLEGAALGRHAPSVRRTEGPQGVGP